MEKEGYMQFSILLQSDGCGGGGGGGKIYMLRDL